MVWTVNTRQMSAVDTPNQLLINSKERSCLYMILANILWKLRIGLWLVAPHMAGQSGEKETWTQRLEFLAEVLYKWPKSFHVCPEGETFISCRCRAQSAANQVRPHPVIGWTQVELPSLAGYLGLKWGHWLGKNGTRWNGKWTCGELLMKVGDNEPLNSDESSFRFV